MPRPRPRRQRQRYEQKYGTEGAIAAAPKRIEAIALDLVEHFAQAIQPGGFKAQIVACSREVACLYQEALARLNAPPSRVMMSAINKDDALLTRHHTTDEERKALIKRFLTQGDPLQILIVCDMLLTGFDAPVEQVMYLDAPLKEHTLLQAIARVNRTDEGKDYGLIVDYWGVSAELQEALAIFSPSDIQGALTPKDDELPRLQTRHAAALRVFVGVQDRDDLDACVAVLETDEARAEFESAWKRFAQSLDLLLPDPRALPYASDARWLGKIRQAAAARYRDPGIDISDCGAKVKKLIEDSIVAEGVQILVQRVSLFTPDFDTKMAALKSDEARASEMEHALKNEIHARLDEDPAFYSSLRARLEKLLQDRKQKRIDTAEQLQLCDALQREIRGRADAAAKLGLSETGLAIYGLLAVSRGLPIADTPGALYGAPRGALRGDRDRRRGRERGGAAQAPEAHAVGKPPAFDGRHAWPARSRGSFTRLPPIQLLP